MGTELVTYQEIQSMGTVLAKSQLFGIKTAEQAIALMLIAQAEGRHPATVAQEYDVIMGRPALKSQAGLIRFQNSGGKVKWIKRTDTECEAEFTHPQGNEIPPINWTMERAKKMGLDKKDNWVKQPMIMLQWRVIAEGIRLCYPACLSGAYLDTEVRDFDPPKKGKPVETEHTVIEGEGHADIAGVEPPSEPIARPSARDQGAKQKSAALPKEVKKLEDRQKGFSIWFNEKFPENSGFDTNAKRNIRLAFLCECIGIDGLVSSAMLTNEQWDMVLDKTKRDPERASRFIQQCILDQQDAPQLQEAKAA